MCLEDDYIDMSVKFSCEIPSDWHTFLLHPVYTSFKHPTIICSRVMNDSHLHYCACALWLSRDLSWGDSPHLWSPYVYSFCHLQGATVKSLHRWKLSFVPLSTLQGLLRMRCVIDCEKPHIGIFLSQIIYSICNFYQATVTIKRRLQVSIPTPLYLTTSKVMVIVWRFRGISSELFNIANVIPLQWAQLTMGLEFVLLCF